MRVAAVVMATIARERIMEHLATLDQNQLGKMLIQMKLAGDSKETMQPVIDAIKRKKP